MTEDDDLMKRTDHQMVEAISDYCENDVYNANPFLYMIDNRRTEANVQDFTQLGRNDTCVMTKDDDLVKCIDDQMVIASPDCCKNDVYKANPFLRMIKNSRARRDGLNTNHFVVETDCKVPLPTNPFLDIIGPAIKDEISALQVSTNPFLVGYNPVMDIADFFSNGVGYVFFDIPYVPTESHKYCKQLIQQHRKFFMKTASSFSI